MSRAASRPRGRPTAQETAELADLLLDAAFEEFVENGYGGASLSRIVRRAKISKTTLYARYSSKEALFRALMQRQVVEAAAKDSLRPTADLDMRAGLTSFAVHMLDRSFDGRLLDVNRLVLSEAHRFPELARAAAENSEQGIRRVSEFLAECSGAAGQSIADPRGVAEAFIHMMRGWYMNQVLTGHIPDKKQRMAWVQTAVDALLPSR